MSSLSASKPAASRSSLTSKGWTRWPARPRRIRSRFSAQGSTWFSQWFACDRIWVNQTTLTQTETPSVAVGGKVLVQQGWHPHLFHLGHQQRHVVDASSDDRQSLGHAETFPQCSKPLQI